MRSAIKRFARLALALVALAAFSSPALAAAPSNDTIANAKLVTLGFSETIDTTQATSDAADAQLNLDCGAPATDASVWYAFDGDGNEVRVDVSASSYSAGALVATGTPGNLTTIACGPNGTVFTAEVGTRYYVMAFDDQTDESGIGGSLSIEFRKAFVPSIEFSVNPSGSFNSLSGAATVSGSITCSAGADFSIFLEVSQKVGRGSVIGFEFSNGVCDGTLQRWSIVVTPNSGKFAGGKLQVHAFGSAFGDIGNDQEISQTVQLRKKY